MDKRPIYWMFKSILLFLIPIFSAIYIFFTSAILSNIFHSILDFVLISFIISLIYGLYYLYNILYWQLHEENIRELGEVRNCTWVKYYLFSLVILLGLILILSHSRSFAVIFALFSTIGFITILEWSRRDLDQRALFLFQNLAKEPSNIHRDLCAEISTWEQTGTLDGMPLVADIGRLSDLIIAEGQEDESDRLEIEEFFAGSMNGLIVDLASLRKLLLGESFLSDTNKQDLESLKIKIGQQKDALQALYQRVVG